MSIKGHLLVLQLGQKSVWHSLFTEASYNVVILPLSDLTQTGHGSLVACMAASYTRGPEFDPLFRLILSWKMFSFYWLKKSKLPVTGERMGTKYW